MLRFGFATVLSLALLACKKAPTEEPLSSFSSPKIGEWIYPLCKKENDGKRYLVRGYLKLSNETTIENDKLSLSLYEKPDGTGTSTQLELVEGKHIKFDTAEVKNTWRAGGVSKHGKVIGVTVLTNNGNASVEERIGAIVEQKVLTKFQSDEVSACQLVVDELTK
jgi:hypothetical protein